MLCSVCSIENPSSSRFCDACGAALELRCQDCGTANRAAARFCGSCGRRLASGAPAPATREQVPLTPPKLADLVLGARFAREGERKLVTVLFADIRGSTEMIHGLDPEQALQRLDPTLRIMSEAVHRFGGTVNRVHGDGIMALFGAPLAHEDHAVRACFAARAMLDGVARLNAQRHPTGLPEDGARGAIRVGLYSGEVVVRSIGNDMSMEYEAVGVTAHLASRVEQVAAPDTACLTAETGRLADGFIMTRPLGAVPLKGIASPVELFELTGTIGRSRWEARAATGLTHFVGRSAELEVLRQAVAGARGGRGSVVEIVGEAGMGKSRLVHELIRECASESCSFVIAAAMPYDSESPYALVSKLARGLLGVTADDGLADIERRLSMALAGLRGSQEEISAALRVLLDLPALDAAWEQLDPRQRRNRLGDAVRALLVRAAKTTFGLVLEDLHWSDTESLAVLSTLLSSIGASHIFVVATSRPEFDSGWPRYSYFSLLRLTALASEDAEQLLGVLLGDSPDLGRLRQQLIARTGGEPLFLEELARSLVETGALQRDGDGFRLARDFETIEVPSSLHAIIAARIDRLPIDCRTVLQIASVIGKDVALGPLRAVADLPEAQLLTQLTALQSLEFLHEVNSPVSLGYTFKHALTHSVAYDGILLKHRRALHGRVLTAIEQLYADRLDEMTERLAHHAMRAEDHAKAVEYNYKAGLRANLRSAYREAVTFLERALQSLARLPETAANADRGIDIRLALRVALLASGDLMQVRLHLEQAEMLARALDDRRLLPIIISRATILVNLGDLDRAVEAALYGRQMAEQGADPEYFISASFALGQAHWNRGDFSAAVAVLSRAIDRTGSNWTRPASGTTGSLPVLCRVSLSHALAFMGDLADANAAARHALDAARETARPYDLSYAHAAQGLNDLILGNLPEAIRHLEEARHFSEAGEIKLLFPHAARYLGRAYALAGMREEARALLERAIDFASERSLAGLNGWCAAALGLTNLLDGQHGAARSAVRTAWEIADRHGYRPLAVHAARLAGAAAATGNDAAALDEAEDWFKRAATIARDIGMKPEMAHTHQELAALLVRTERHEEAHSALSIAIRLFRGMGAQGLAARAEQEVLTPYPA